MVKELGKKLKKFSLETRLESAEALKDKLLQLFKGYIKSIIVWGSITRGDYTGKSDVDVYIIFDDTKFPLKKFDEIRDKIDRDVYNAAAQIDPRLHPQPVIALTEFMRGMRTTHPLFFNIVREGYAIYDTGYFIPMRKMLEMGEFPATEEAAQIRMEAVPKRIARVKNVKLYVIAEDLYFSLMDAAQAALMYIGVNPPPPKVAVKTLREHLVSAGFLEEEYAKTLEDIVDFRKKVEHKEINDIKGEEVDKWIERCEKYVERFEKLLKELESNRKANDIRNNYEIMVKASVAALKSLKKLPPEPEKLPEAFKKYLVDAGLISPLYGDVFDKVVEMRKLLDDKKIDKVTDRQVYMNKEYVRRFLGEIRRFIGKPIDVKSPVEEKMDEAKELVNTVKEVKDIEKKTKRKK